MAMRRDRLLVMLLIACGAILRFWGLGFGLPHDFARPDEEKLIGAALGIFQGDPNPHFFLYPTLFIYLIAAAYTVVFGVERLAGAAATQAGFVAQAIADPSLLHLPARILSAAAGVATIPALFLAARELSSTRTALIASALLTVTFLHVRDSHFGVTDVPVTFLTVCAFWAAARCAARGATGARVAGAGLLCGLAASTKYNSALVALPAVIAIAADGRGTPVWRRISLVALLFGCLGAAFLIGTPFALLDRRAFLADFVIQSNTALGTHHGSILDAARAAVAERGWIHHATFTLRHGLGLPLLFAAITGACWLIAGQARTAAIVLSFPIAFYAAMGVSLLVYARWMLPIVPFLCLTAAVFVDRLADVSGRVFRSRRAAVICTAAMLVLLGAPTLARSVSFDRLATQPDTRVLGARWIEAHYPAGATLYQTGAIYGFLQPRPPDRYRLIAFDEHRGRFWNASARAADEPDLIVVLESPLAVFSHVPNGLNAVLDADYDWVETFKGTVTARISRAVYDQQDAFYMPFANLDSIRRPGPDVRIFERRGH